MPRRTIMKYGIITTDLLPQIIIKILDYRISRANKGDKGFFPLGTRNFHRILSCRNFIIKEIKFRVPQKYKKIKRKENVPVFQVFPAIVLR